MTDTVGRRSCALLQRLRDLAYAGAIDRLYVHCPDRLARKYAYWDLLDRNGPTAIFPRLQIAVMSRQPRSFMQPSQKNTVTEQPVVGADFFLGNRRKVERFRPVFAWIRLVAGALTRST